MATRREALQSIKADATTHAGLWLETGLLDVGEKGSARQDHLIAVLGTVKAPAEYGRFFRRWRSALETLPPCTRMVEAAVLGRMVVGLGAESVLETSIALHRTYGVPYIPGSALKGLAAAAAHKFLVDNKWRKASAEKEIGESHRLMFGDTESSGYVTFHDALWIPEGDGRSLPLDLDVMTVHHPDYYQGKENAPPADWDSPTPVSFVSARGRYLLAVTGFEEWVDAALEILAEALERDGIGAKTAAGYGRMKASLEKKASSSKTTASSSSSQSSKPIWEARVRAIGLNNADHEVPRLFKELSEEDRKAAAKAIIERLEKRTLRKKKEKEWVRLVFEAAGE